MTNHSHPAPIFYDPSKHHHILSQIASIHHDCVIHDFMPSRNLDVSDRPKLEWYWFHKHAEVELGERVIALQFADDGHGSEELAGLGCLSLPDEETEPCRCWIEKLMVRSRHRRKGFARRLVEKLEEAARERNAQSVQLATKAGTPAAEVYPRLGYKVWGKSPRSPKDGSLEHNIHFYKDLRDE